MAARRAGEGERLLRAKAWTGWEPTQLLGTHVTASPSASWAWAASARRWPARPLRLRDAVIFHNRSPKSCLRATGPHAPGRDARGGRGGGHRPGRRRDAPPDRPRRDRGHAPAPSWSTWREAASWTRRPWPTPWTPGACARASTSTTASQP
jgi:hypothetical protein